MRASAEAPVPAPVRALRVLARGLLALSPAVRWVPAVGWMTLTFVLSMQDFGIGGGTGLSWGILSNGYHCFEYGVLAIFLALFLPREQGWPRLGPRETRWIVLAAGLYGMSDEIHQAFVPSRNCSILDLLSDVTGAWLATRAAARAGGIDYDPRRLARIVLFGIPLCFLCGTLAELMPRWFPDVALF
jgi:VanZ like family